MRASRGRARQVLSYLAMFATLVGFARAAFPVRPHGNGRATFTIAADDSSPTVNTARLPRTSFRRAALVLGPALPDLADVMTPSGDENARRFERGWLFPKSIAPTPPFRPPRRV